MKWRYLALICMAAGLWAAIPAAGADEAQDPGQVEFLEQKCETCHSISSHDIRHTGKIKKLIGPDLAGVGDRHEAAWMIAYIKREQVGESGKKHTKPFKGSDEELQAIVDWLASLKTEESNPEP